MIFINKINKQNNNNNHNLQLCYKVGNAYLCIILNEEVHNSNCILKPNC